MGRPPQAAAAEPPQAACAVRCRKAVILDPGQDLAALAREAAPGGAEALGAATGRWRWWPRWRLRTVSRSCAFRPGRATISRSTWAWTGAT
jgi:hypothetical protein